MTQDNTSPLQGVNLETLSDEQIDKMAADLGITDDDGDTGALGDGAPPATAGDGAGSAVGGGASDKPQADAAEQPKLTGQALLEALRSSPEAQTLVQQQLDTWLQSAAADAADKKQQEEFNTLIADGNFEEIGRRYVRAESESKIRTAAENEATTKAYGEIYTNIFKQPELQALSADEKVKLDSGNFFTDAEYVLALTDFIAAKRSGSSDDERVNKLVDEKLEALRNIKASTSASQPSVSSLPGGLPHQPGSEKQTARDLIREGYHEVLEDRANNRVGVNS